MLVLKTFDEKNYTEDMPVYTKYAVRAVIIRDGKIATQKAKSGYYKILGGGVDTGESYEDALVREVREESGLVVKPESINLIGEIVEKRQDLFNKEYVYECHSIFYFCDVEEKLVDTNLTASEIREGFELEWEEPQSVIEANERIFKVADDKKKPWVERDTYFIKQLVSDSYLNK